MRTIYLLFASLAACGSASPHGTTATPDTVKVVRGTRSGKPRFVDHVRKGDLPALGSLEGTVRDDRRDPVFGLTVVVTGPTLPDARQAMTDRSGKFSVVGLPPGEYKASYFHQHAEFSHARIAVQAGMITVEDVFDAPVRVERE